MYYFTAEIIFLGVTATKFSKKLETNLYCKPTNTQQYLHAQSRHKGSISYGQVARFKRI